MGSMKVLEPKLELLNGVVGTTQSLSNVIDTITDVISLLVCRDYTFDKEAFENEVDISEVHEALPLLLEACGLAQKKTS
jgi:hypothetical protein